MRHRASNTSYHPLNQGPLAATPPIDSAQVVALIVTYHPDPEIAIRMRPLLDTVGGMLFVDNGSHQGELVPVNSLLLEGSAHLIHNDRNLGLATALNQGFRWAVDHKFTWVLTLDQDTAPTGAVVSEAARIVAASGDRPVAVIGAGWSDTPATGISVGGDRAYVVTSGALNSVGAWQQLGGFRDDFFIDFVDVEYCLRARSAGYAVLQSGIRTIDHSVGQPTRHRTRSRGFTTSNHDRIRRYYITRNRVIVWRAYARGERSFTVSDIRRALKELIKLVLFESDRPGKVRAVARGAWDGIRGVTDAVRSG